MNSFSIEGIRQDLKEFPAKTGKSLRWLARQSGVTQPGLSSFISGKVKSLSGKSIELIHPFLYGDKRPSAPPEARP